MSEVQRYGSEGFKYDEPLTERLSKSQGMIGKMCSEHRPPRMSIPAGMDILYGGDEDLYITDALRDAVDRITELEAEVEHWQATAQRLKHQLIIDSEEDDNE